MYNEINPDLILVTSHGYKNEEKIKIFNYIVYKAINQKNAIMDVQQQLNVI